MVIIITVSASLLVPYIFMIVLWQSYWLKVRCSLDSFMQILVLPPFWFSGWFFVCFSPHLPLLAFIDTDWSSEYSSGAEDLLSGSRETSVRESRSRSASVRHEGNKEHGGRRSEENTFKDLSCGQTGGWLAEGGERFHRNSNQKSSESPAVAWQNVVEEEE